MHAHTLAIPSKENGDGVFSLYHSIPQARKLLIQYQARRPPDILVAIVFFASPKLDLLIGSVICHVFGTLRIFHLLSAEPTDGSVWILYSLWCMQFLLLVDQYVLSQLAFVLFIHTFPFVFMIPNLNPVLLIHCKLILGFFKS